MMKSMNYSTVIGLFISVLLFGFIFIFKAQNPLSFINGAGLAIVIGGTIAALFISYPLREIKQAFRTLKTILFYESLNPQKEANEIIAVSKMWFGRDSIAVENEIEKINNPYLRAGIQLVVDKTPVEDILSLLRWRIARLRAKEKTAADIFRSMSYFAPAFGMIGTLVGLINMLQIIEAKDIGLITLNMGMALTTTFYGLILANLIFNPIAIKLERRTEQRVMIMSMVMEGIILITDRRTPSFIRETLNSFLTHHDNDLHEPIILDENADNPLL